MAEHPEHDVILRVADAIGSLMEFWGFKRNMGRMWTLLYLEPTPLSAAQLGERLSLSSGAVSMLLSELTHWGAVKKAWVPGERRDYYEPETSIWKMVSRVFRERELRKIASTIEVFEHALQRLRLRLDRATDEDQRSRLQLVIDRIDGLLSLARTGERLLKAILSGQSIDASPLRTFGDHEGSDDR
jgi:HTH-type transcriptional regulator, glycine betaine synthesis regulator